MRKIETEQGITIFMSSDRFKDSKHEDRLGWVLSDLIGSRFGKYFEGVWQRYIELFSKRHRLKGAAILAAHGDVDDDWRWLYVDRGTTRPVQSWIDKHDGKYACLMIESCNPGAVTVTSKKSLLVIADRNVGNRIDYIFGLIHPQDGEIDEYIVEHEAEKASALLSS
ncbi:hypothetical protein IID24_01405 [Patescibacteria group bacterium]|nr:hypothetical protein [Patescibacteria group bacterium]